MSGGSLRKTLGMADVFCISAGAMISSGIFVLPGVAYENIGPAVFLAYGLAGICALVGTLATIELATCDCVKELVCDFRYVGSGVSVFWYKSGILRDRFDADISAG